ESAEIRAEYFSGEGGGLSEGDATCLACGRAGELHFAANCAGKVKLAINAATVSGEIREMPRGFAIQRRRTLRPAGPSPAPTDKTEVSVPFPIKTRWRGAGRG